MQDAELVERIAATTGLSPREAARVVADVLAWHDEGVESYVRRRHGELKTFGRRNDEIFAQLADELRGRRFTAPDLSERQLRRIVYG